MEDSIRQELMFLFLDYSRELRDINGGYLPGDELMSDVTLFYEYCDETLFEWHPIYYDEKMVGFLLTSDREHGNITEAYISPLYRGFGLMEHTVTRYMIGKSSCLHMVLKTNVNACEYWNHLFQKLGYRSVSIPRAEDDGLLVLEWVR